MNISITNIESYTVEPPKTMNVHALYNVQDLVRSVVCVYNSIRGGWVAGVSSPIHYRITGISHTLLTTPSTCLQRFELTTAAV